MTQNPTNALYWKKQAENLTEQIAALTRRIEQDATNWKILWQGAQEENERLKSLLPEEMPNRKIIFKSCPVGHGRLIGKNWIDPGCPYCKIDRLNKELKEQDKIDIFTQEIFTSQNQQIAALQKEVEAGKKEITGKISKCVCDHYHCPICGNQMEMTKDATWQSDQLTRKEREG